MLPLGIRIIMIHKKDVELAPPGAGLPLPELLVARILFSLRICLHSRTSFDAKFANERKLIGNLIKKCDSETGCSRQLIPRIVGLEDSSRNWSVWMTLEHLKLVHQAMTPMIEQLLRGQSPPIKISTANFKPTAEVGVEVVAQYELSCDRLVSVVTSAPSLKTKARFEHPWFGPLNAVGWHALAGLHMGIHRRQIEKILDKLIAEKT